MVFNTFTVSAAVTPEIVSCAFSHYFNRRSLRQKPTAHISYHEGLRVVRHFIDYASHHTVEDIQAFTGQWVPAPRWVKLKALHVPDEFLKESAKHIQEHLGSKGLEAVGGREWWQWRQGDASLKAEWIEMRSDYNLRRRDGQKGKRVILYVHGGAYYFGSVDEHRYQMQRHARKLKARCLAPRYRLSPQYPFPCGLQDCLAAYLYLLKENEPSEILLAGDSAGGGMTLAMLLIIRDQGLPLPAGALLLSPWVDLTHSFPSLGGDGAFDYIPAHGFHHRPSRSWPAPAEPSANGMVTEAEDAHNGPPQHQFAPDLVVVIDGKQVAIKDQIQMYAPNHLLSHPLVSPVLAPSLGGLPPLLVQAGSGELLVDEQIYLAHKAANPAKYLPRDPMLAETDTHGVTQKQYGPTDVQLQVWDDLCHVPHTLAWTRPAKYMYRAVAQFGAWALARAQQQKIDILDDDNISEISVDSSTTSITSSTDDATAEALKPRGGDRQSQYVGNATQQPGIASANNHSSEQSTESIGKAGDPLPLFTDHMIRQRVDRHGDCYPLPPPSDIPALNLPRDSIGTIKEGPARKWLAARSKWDGQYASVTERLAKQREKQRQYGFVNPGVEEKPPPTALAGRRRLDKNGKEILESRKLGRSWGMSLWSLWGSKHDEKTLQREDEVQMALKSAEKSAADNTPRVGGEEVSENGIHGLPTTHTTTPRIQSRSRSKSKSKTRSRIGRQHSSKGSIHYAQVADLGQAGASPHASKSSNQPVSPYKSTNPSNPTTAGPVIRNPTEANGGPKGNNSASRKIATV